MKTVFCLAMLGVVAFVAYAAMYGPPHPSVRLADPAAAAAPAPPAGLETVSAAIGDLADLVEGFGKEQLRQGRGLDMLRKDLQAARDAITGLQAGLAVQPDAGAAPKAQRRKARGKRAARRPQPTASPGWLF